MPVYAQSPVYLALDLGVDESVQYDAGNFRQLIESILKQTKRSLLVLEAAPPEAQPSVVTAAYRINGTIQLQEEPYYSVRMKVFDCERNQTLFNERLYATSDPDFLHETLQELADKAVDSVLSCLDQKAQDHLALLNQEKEALEKRIASLTEQNQDLITRLADFTQWEKDLDERVSALHQRNQDLDDNINGLSQRNQDLNKQLDTMDQANQALYAQLEMLQNFVSPALPENFVHIPSGTFVMGSPRSELSRDSDEVQRTITISAFFMSRTEVTQKEWQEVMGNNPSHFQGSDLPVENISWFDAVEYCNKRSIQEGLTPAYTIASAAKDGTRIVTWHKEANGYRLPTEAEWEYACRAGTTTPFYMGTTVRTEDANFDGTVAYNGVKSGYKNRTAEVEAYTSNLWGLFAMHGNVWEWCWDWYGTYAPNAQTDPAGAKTGVNRIMRGGSWNFYAQYLRSANRGSNLPTYRNYDLGLRLVRP
jgi:formylglycine-generating enzyme required for sulfatase activity